MGGGGSKPGKFGVYNASGQQIGFIGVEGANEGGWFKTLAVGGNDASSAYLKADASGIVTLTGAKVSVTGTYTEGSGYSTTAEINPGGSLIPFRVYSAYGRSRQQQRETWTEDGEVSVVGNNANNRYPLGRPRTAPRHAAAWNSGPAALSSDGRLFGYAESEEPRAVRHGNLLPGPATHTARQHQTDTGDKLLIRTRLSTSATSPSIVIADGYAGDSGCSVTLGYKKDDGTVVRMTLQGGLELPPGPAHQSHVS